MRIRHGIDKAFYADLWDVPGGRMLRRLGRACIAAFHPAGGVLATAGADGIVRLWSGDDGALLGKDGGDSRVIGVAFFGGGSRLVTVERDGTIRSRMVAGRPPSA